MAGENARVIVSVIASSGRRSVPGLLLEPGLTDIDRHHQRFQDRPARADSNPPDVNVPK